MNADERTLLTRFLDELASSRAGQKDPEADALIARALAASPDAAYLLVQHAIVADQSLHAAQQRIAELERQQPPASSGFLPPSGGAGPWGAPPADPYAQSGYAPGYAPSAYAPPPVDARPGIFSSGGGLGSFLRSAGTTAAGVAGGEMLFSGLSDLFGHHGGGMFGGGQGFGGQGFMEQPENVTINNYGDDQRDDGNDDDSSDNDDDS